MVKERQYGRELGRGPSSLFTGPPSVWPTPTLERWRLQSSRFSSSVALDERPPHSPPGSGAQFEAEQWENIWWTSSKGEVSEQTAPFFFFFLKSETRNKASVGQSPKAEKHVFASICLFILAVFKISPLFFLLHPSVFLFQASRSVFLSLSSFFSFSLHQEHRQLPLGAIKRGDEITRRACFESTDAFAAVNAFFSFSQNQQTPLSRRP